MKRQVKSQSRNRKVIKRELKRMVIVLMIIGLIFSALGLYNKGKEVDILIKKHQQQTTEYDKRLKEYDTKIQELEEQNAQLKETVVYQYESYQEKLSEFKEPSVKQQPQQEMVVNVKPKVDEQAVTSEKEVHNEQGIVDVPIIITSTLVVAKGILQYLLKPSLLP